MKRIVAFLQKKIDSVKIERKINRIQRAIDSAIDNAQEQPYFFIMIYFQNLLKFLR